ncbi:hypothetical protein FB446DRAFT_709377 [Lentinula raphanica]|nr:hypothetical protein FB446DRAFT_709377 [Lentinula raphanica]
MSYAVGNSRYNNHRGSMFENASYFKIENTTLNASGRDINNYYKSPHDEDKNIQQWLAAPDCSVNLFTAFDKIVDGTSQWIFEDETYLKWKETGAGSGKTVLMPSKYYVFILLIIAHKVGLFLTKLCPKLSVILREKEEKEKSVDHLTGGEFTQKVRRVFLGFQSLEALLGTFLQFQVQASLLSTLSQGPAICARISIPQ